MAVAVVGDVDLIGGDVVAEFANRAQQLLPLRADLFAIEHGLQPIYEPQRLIDVAVPQVPLQAFQILLDFAQPSCRFPNNSLQKALSVISCALAGQEIRHFAETNYGSSTSVR